jgi:hypothetical protein
MTRSQTLSKGRNLSWKISASTAVTLMILAGTEGFAVGKPEFQGGLQMGYTYGQNGVGFPSFGKDPLGNPGRAGFYLAQLRLKATLPFDSTFRAVALGNAYGADLQEIYLEKKVRNYTFTAGKFRGAGVKSLTGEDDFERATIYAPRYARLWSYYKKLQGSRDFGVQAEVDYFGGDLRHRFFMHNANRQNIINEEPSNNAGPAAQAAGFDYALDWRFSPFTAWGGHVGALADHAWSEFLGTEEGWKVGNWFRTNPIVDGSLYHQMDMGRFHMFNEAQMLLNRELHNPVDSGATRTWGVSTMVRFEHTRRLESLFRYEFQDPTDGAIPNDNLHLITAGLIFRPSPAAFPDMKLTTEYVRTLEDGFQNTVQNDVLFSQLQMLF